MPAAVSFRKPAPKIQVLFRAPPRGGVNPVPFRAQPELEIVDVFRIDVVEQALGLPPPDLFVRFVINQNDNGADHWTLYDPLAPVEFGYDPEWDQSSSSSEPEPDESGPDDWIDHIWWIMFSAGDSSYTATAISALANSTNWRAWWMSNGHSEGYQLLFDVAGLREHRRRVQDLPEEERSLIWDTWDYMMKGTNDSKTLLLAFPHLSDLPSTMRYFASTLGQ